MASPFDNLRQGQVGFTTEKCMPDSSDDVNALLDGKYNKQDLENRGIRNIQNIVLGPKTSLQYFTADGHQGNPTQFDNSDLTTKVIGCEEQNSKIASVIVNPLMTDNNPNTKSTNGLVSDAIISATSSKHLQTRNFEQHIKNNQVAFLTHSPVSRDSIDMRVLEEGNYLASHLGLKKIYDNAIMAIIIGPNTSIQYFDEDNFSGNGIVVDNNSSSNIKILGYEELVQQNMFKNISSLVIQNNIDNQQQPIPQETKQLPQIQIQKDDQAKQTIKCMIGDQQITGEVEIVNGQINGHVINNEKPFIKHNSILPQPPQPELNFKPFCEADGRQYVPNTANNFPQFNQQCTDMKTNQCSDLKTNQCNSQNLEKCGQYDLIEGFGNKNQSYLSKFISNPSLPIYILILIVLLMIFYCLACKN
jgi:hypothetical protein